MHNIHREAAIRDVADTPDIKVITGVRRSGKSKLIEALAQTLLDNQPDANIIHINYNLTDFEDIMDYQSLEAYVEGHFVPGRQNYLLIDEVQMCATFEKAINSLQARERSSISKCRTAFPTSRHSSAKCPPYLRYGTHIRR